MNYTYLSILSSDIYLDGALIVNEALKRVNSKYPFTVMVTSPVSQESEEILNKKGINTIRKNQRIMMDIAHRKKNAYHGYEYWNYSFDSLFIFELTQFDKIIYIDCDMVPLINLDNLFEYPNLSACFDPGTRVLNAGFMVIEPKEGEFQKILSVIPEVMRKRDFFADQHILQEYDKNWSNEEEKHIDGKYNVFMIYLDWFYYNGFTFGGKENSIGIVHFIGCRKPWMFTADEDRKWREEFLKKNNPFGIKTLDYMKELLEAAKAN